MISIGTTLIGLSNAVDINLQDVDVLVVGQNPSSKASQKNNTFDRLNQWLGFLGVITYGFVNACSKEGKVSQSDVCLDNLVKACYKAKRIIALGNFPSEALNRVSIEHFKLPHPSPLNRQINDKDYILSRLVDCKSYLYK